jgi:hypothetical protein
MNKCQSIIYGHKIIKASNNKKWMGFNLFGQCTNCLQVENKCNFTNHLFLSCLFHKARPYVIFLLSYSSNGSKKKVGDY